MHLSPNQVNKFYSIWFSLLRFVNSERKLINESLLSGVGVEPQDAIIVRDVLWSDNKLLDAFIKTNPEELATADLEIARSWRWRVGEAPSLKALSEQKWRSCDDLLQSEDILGRRLWKTTEKHR